MKQSSELSNQQSQNTAQKKKNNAVINALIIGFLIGIIIYSAVNNSIGFLTLIPLFFIYKMVNKPESNENEIS